MRHRTGQAGRVVRSVVFTMAMIARLNEVAQTWRPCSLCDCFHGLSCLLVVLCFCLKLVIFYVLSTNKCTTATIPTQASLLRPWIACFTIIISARWNLISSKLKKSLAKTQPENSETMQLLSEFEFVLCI